MNFAKLVLGLVILSGITSVVSAGCVVEKQGDTVYLGEYCDVSKVMAWSSEFAYFSSGYESDTPTKIVKVEGFMYRHYIDPTKYVVGDWYKWEGYLERGGNSLAFIVAEGKRNETVSNESVVGNITANVTPQPPEKTNPKDTELLVARGDSMAMSYALEGEEQGGYIWFFGGINTKILGVKTEVNDGVNSYVFTPEETASYTVGRYTGYFQFVGNNGRQDVFYDKEHNNLDSPYKNVDPVNLDPFIPSRIQTEFEKLSANSEYCDDILIPISMEVVEPEIKIGGYWEEFDDVIIEGTTSVSPGTTITVAIDPDNFALPIDIAANTYVTEAVGSVGEWRKFSIRMPLKWDQMKVGDHKIRASISKYKMKTSMDKDFDVSGIWVNPTPTPEFRKVIVGEYGTHMVNEQGIVINSSGLGTEITPIPTIPVKPTMTPPVVKPEVVFTPKPTGVVKAAPTDDVTIPLNPIAAFGALIIVVIVFHRKR